MAATVEVIARADVAIDRIHWNIPEELTLRTGTGGGGLPVTLTAGDTWRYEQLFMSEYGEESYAELRGSLVFRSGDASESRTAEWNHWLSIFAQAAAGESEPLSDELRDRLIGVTNARPRNGHIFLADHVRYFADYLNILIPERLAAILAREFGLSDQGLPVDEEQYLLFAQGRRTFYGIEKLELLAEEYCNESDDRLDLDDLREVSPSDVDLNT